MKALALLRVSLTAGDLHRLTAFYVEALGFAAEPERRMDGAMAALLGARSVRTVLLRRGAQTLELASFDPPGLAYQPGSNSNDAWFQHCALVTEDIGAAAHRLRGTAFTPLSRSGPQALPGGIAAFKFRDPEGHPLELIQFPGPRPETAGGIDHSAIAVADAARSIAFYTSRLGMGVTAAQINSGPAQDALDGLDGTEVDVVALAPTQPAPASRAAWLSRAARTDIAAAAPGRRGSEPAGAGDRRPGGTARRCLDGGSRRRLPDARSRRTRPAAHPAFRLNGRAEDDA